MDRGTDPTEPTLDWLTGVLRTLILIHVQRQVDIEALVRTLAARIRVAAAPALSEGLMSKTASVASRRQRVIAELASIDHDVNTLPVDRSYVVERLGDEFSIGPVFDWILKESHAKELIHLGGYWVKFFGGIGL